MAIRQTPELEDCLRKAAETKAYNMFLIPGEPLILRIGADYERMEQDVFTADQIYETAVAALGEEAVARIGPEVGDIRTSCGLPGIIEGRMCVARSDGRLTIGISVMENRIPTLKEISAPPAMIQAANTARGLMIFSGPYGCGKTTTAVAVLDHINATTTEHICTVEDTIFFALSPKKSFIQQRAVGADVPDCVSGIRAAIAQETDVLWVGDPTTVEEVDAVLAAAMRCRLVLTQLHAKTAEDAVRSIIEVQPEDLRPSCRKILADRLATVSTQRLVRTADGKTRTAVYGILIPDDEMREAIREGRDILCRNTPLPEGCQTLAEHGERLVNEGVVTREELRRALSQ